MESISYTNKELFTFLVAEKQCALQKLECNRHCADCPYFTEAAQTMYSQLIEMIKARDPELYFVDELEQIKSIMRRKTK